MRKTTIANQLREKYGFYIYSTDDSREKHMERADPKDQPYMCRDFEHEYGVKDFWELPAEVIRERENHFLTEMTPMILMDLIELSAQYDTIVCEGDIDYRAVARISSHCVHLCNCGTSFDFFLRPDHENIYESLAMRDDLNDSEKQAVLRNAYKAVSGNKGAVPDWVTELNIKNINWYDETSVKETVSEVESYFGFGKQDRL